MRTSTHVNKARPTQWAVFFILTLTILAGCRKPDEDLGLGLLPGDPLGSTGEEFPIHAFTFRPDPIRTSGLTRNLVGSYLDPDFGLVRTGMVAQLRLSSSNVGQGQNNDDLIADSLVLALAFDATSSHYAGLGAQRFVVMEVAENLSVDTVYQTDDVPEVIGEDLIASHANIVAPDPLARVPVLGGDTLPPQVRLRLDQSLAQRFLQAFGTQDLADNNSFLQFFKGLYVTVANGQQLPYQEGILYMDLLNAASKVTLYYHDLNDPEPRRYDFPINENSVRYTVADLDASQAIVPGLQQALQDTVTEPTTLYLQALGGARIAVRMPDLQAVDGRVLVKAELILPLQGSTPPNLSPPALLFLFRKDETGQDAFLPDQLGGAGVIDGAFRPQAREYRFNITRYLQGILNGSIPNNGFEIVTGSNAVTADRAIFAGPAAEGSRMKLLLTFTTY